MEHPCTLEGTTEEVLTMAETYDTALGLLNQAAEALGAAADMCDQPEDAVALSDLAGRILQYLSASRSTTTLGMPRIVSQGNELSEEMVVRRNEDHQRGHVRIVPAPTE